MAKQNVWQSTVEALKTESVKYVFGLPGNPAQLYYAMYDSPGITPILVREETSGVWLAMAYSKVTGQPGIVFASPGPGMANIVPGLLEAYSGCSPIIAICGAAPESIYGMGAFQEAEQLLMAKPITKWAFRVEQPERMPWALRRAFYLAQNGKPGPVYLEVPFDIGQMEVEMPPYQKSIQGIRMPADPEMVEKAADLIAEAKRPMLVAGGGAALSGASAEIRELVDLMGMPVMTTPSGRGTISEDHPLALGQTGIYFTKVGEKAYGESDLLITVGSRNEEFQTEAFAIFPKGAKYIQIDIDAFEVGRNWVPDVPLVGDAKMVLGQMLSAVKAKLAGKTPDKSRAHELMGAKSQLLAEIAKEVMTDSVPIKTKRVLYEANQVFGKDTILVNENGSQDLWSYYSPYYRVMDLGGCVAPAEQTCMGLGVAGVIGAKLGAPDKKVICVTGDGAFQMEMKEIATAAELKAGVTWLVLDNYSLGWPKYHEKVDGGRYIATDFSVHVDFTKVAAASGCYGEKVERPEQIRGAMERALKANQDGVPAVLDIIVDPWDFTARFHDHHHAPPEVRGE